MFHTVQSHQRLKEGLNGVDLLDPGPLMDKVRAVKSEQEIFYMKRAGVLVQQAMENVLHTIKPGMRECDAMATAYEQAIRGTPEFCGGVPSEPAIARGEKAISAQTMYSEDVFKKQEVANLELVASHRHYHAALARTVFLGQPTPDFLRMSGVVLHAFDAALDAMRPGETCENVEAAWKKIINSAGYEKDSRIGYSIGMGFPPDWGENSASLQPGDKTVLMENMTFHLVCGMWTGRNNMIVSESLRITDGEPELFCNLRRKLYIRPS
jgi:Xaa-Pro dipeptidase